VLSVLSYNFSVEIPLRKSCVDIVVILLYEGGDVAQWLEHQNISLCLCLIHYLSTLSLLYLAKLYIVHIHILDIVCLCPHLCLTKRAH